MAIACMTQKNKTGFFYIMVLRKAGMSIKKLKKFVNLYMKDSSTAEIRKHLLIVQRSQLNKEIINIKKKQLIILIIKLIILMINC